MLVSLLVVLGMFYAVTWWAGREVRPFYDIYVERIGGYPTRQERQAREAKDPSTPLRRLFEPGRFGIAQVYARVRDPEVESHRGRAQRALAIVWLAFIVSLPLLQIVDAMAGGNPLPPGWLPGTIFRSIALIVLGRSIVAFAVARANPSTPVWWQWACVGAIAGAVLFYALALLLIR